MHSYDVEGRGRIYAGLAVLSVLLVWLLDFGLESVDVDPPWWLGAPSVVGVYAGLFWFYDRYGWRWRPLHKLGILSVPDLNEHWIGAIDSSHGENGIRAEVSATITQRWVAILIVLATEQSQSRSQVATLRIKDIERPELTYTYLNEPHNRASETMQTHRGTCTLWLAGETLEGNYYTGRGRGTVGELKLRKTQDDSERSR